ncbi:hypothetical protein HGRIS_014653 [Hohenbuehelia grisea]|uniref:Late embryogenesis abundant protein n=1 Tax=Hohenbuehelia grisea TaxID=104357 RepID=A0ABR3JU40_9AGAR
MGNDNEQKNEQKNENKDENKNEQNNNNNNNNNNNDNNNNQQQQQNTSNPNTNQGALDNIIDKGVQYAAKQAGYNIVRARGPSWNADVDLEDLILKDESTADKIGDGISDGLKKFGGDKFGL